MNPYATSPEDDPIGYGLDPEPCCGNCQMAKGTGKCTYGIEASDNWCPNHKPITIHDQPMTENTPKPIGGAPWLIEHL